MDYSSLTIGIIVLCVGSSLLVATLGVVLIVKRQQTSSTSVAKEKQNDEITSSVTADSMNYQNNNIPKIKFTPSPAYFLFSSKKKMVPAPASSVGTSDIQIPVSVPPSPPRPSLLPAETKWKHDQHVEERSPIAFEEGYDPKAMRLPYYSSRQSQAHLPYQKSYLEYTHPLPYNMDNSPPSGETHSPCYIDDPCLLESLEREKHINDIYYRTTPVKTSTTALHRHHHSTSSWGSSTIIQSPCIHDMYSNISNSNCNNNSSLLSLSMAEKHQQDAELQRLSASSYYVW